LLQGLRKRREPCLTFRIASGPVYEDANPTHLLGLLRARHKRPRGC